MSNLLVVVCSEQNTQPVVNAGSLYGEPPVAEKKASCCASTASRTTR